MVIILFYIKYSTQNMLIKFFIKGIQFAYTKLISITILIDNEPYFIIKDNDDKNY